MLSDNYTLMSYHIKILGFLLYISTAWDTTPIEQCLVVGSFGGMVKYSGKEEKTSW